MKRENLLREARKVVRAVQKLPQVKAVGLYGSLGKGYSDRFTKEFDLFVLCQDFPKLSARKKAMLPVVSHWDTAYEKFHQLDVYDMPGIKGCVCWYLKIPEVESQIRSFKSKRPPHWDLVNYIVNGRALWDPKGLLRKWKKQMSRYPEWLRKERVGMLTGVFRFTRGDIQRVALARNNTNYLQTRLPEVKNMLDEVVYALNRTYYAWGTISGKWAFRDYKTFRLLPRDWFSQLDKFNDPRGLPVKKRIQILDHLAEETLQIVKKNMPGLSIKTEGFD